MIFDEGQLLWHMNVEQMYIWVEDYLSLIYLELRIRKIIAYIEYMKYLKPSSKWSVADMLMQNFV